MMIGCYRIVYGIVVAVFLGNVLKASYFSSVPHYIVALMIATAGLLCGLIVLLIAFSQVRPTVSWSVVLVWEAFFIWYGWFSPSSPFALHELHTMDPPMAAREASAHFVVAIAVFVVLFVWFLSLPIVQSAYSRRKGLRP
jgi:hypothetical protein